MKNTSFQIGEVEKYLVATRLCDSDDPWLKRKAEETVLGATDPNEKALRIFRFVRDGIRFAISYSESKASQTLKQGYGECGTKIEIEWDGESSLTLLDYWITEDQGIVFPSWDNALEHLRRSNEGMPPRIIDRLFAGLIYPPFARKTDEIRAIGRVQ